MLFDSLCIQSKHFVFNQHWQKFYRPFLLLIVISAAAPTIYAGHGELEELLITDSQDRRHIDVSDTLEITPDATALLRKAPGATVNGNGPLSGIAQYRGMYGGRINIEVNGMTLSSGGPNWMDPPLHYAPAAQLDSLEVFRGIAPVSAGQETIGGVVNAKTWDGDFGTGDQFESSGRIRSGGQSVNNATVASIAIVQSNQQHRFKLSALTESADDADFNGGNITPSEYQRDRYDVGYGFQHNAHQWRFDIGRNETGDGGTAALPMDISFIDANMASTQYRYEADDWLLSAKLYYSEIKHGMSNYHLRTAPMVNSRWRRNTAVSDNLGFKISAELNDNNGNWTVGIDGHSEIHNSDIDNPNNTMFFVTNFNDAKRDVLGIFVERKQTLSDRWSAESGLRVNQIKMNADKVDATPAQITMMGMSPARMLRNNFNDADRTQTDNNADWVAKIYYQAEKATTYYLGVARKTRSASYQERYLWLPLQATGGLADGRTYTGNIELDAETTAEVEFGFDFHSTHLSVSPRMYYRDIANYIQGTVSTNSNAVMFVSMMNTMNGTNNKAPLEFNNVDASIYGFDMDWSVTIDKQWSLSGLLNYVRGERDDISDYLYRISPANASLALSYQSNRWLIVTETVVYAKQDKISKTNSEQQTAGYSLLNIKGSWQMSNELRLGFGIENVTDKNYADHLGGYNRAMNATIDSGEHLPGFGRNFFARVDYNW